MILFSNVKYVSSALTFIIQRKVFCSLQTLSHGISTRPETFKFSDLDITLVEPSQKKAKPDYDSLVFGQHFSDHMFEVEWTSSEGWGKPRICPIHNFSLHPAAKVFHYAQELFEGMKAFRGTNNQVLLFRPNLNIKRMLSSSKRALLPLFDEEEFLKCLKKLISIEKDWVPNDTSCSLYIRPTYIGTEPSLGVAGSNKALLYVITGPVGPYFRSGLRTPVSLYADPQYVRAWPGGIGDKKMGANYAPTIYVQNQAVRNNCQQVLWLYGKDHQLTEVGTMNIFTFLINRNGEKELVTPPLSGIILPGVVRQSLLELAREWNEFKVSERSITMQEVIDALKNNKLIEMFGCGTACVVCPIKSIKYMGSEIAIPTTVDTNAISNRFYKTLQDIQTGKTTSDWAVSVD